MDLQFDKEINAILRKARDASPVNAGAANTEHVDADAIAAFAENALPEGTRRTYMSHFADCDRCRQMLSRSISLLSEAEVTAASSVSDTMAVTPAIKPWYERLFRSPNLALAMGALVLSFAGILGYLVVERSRDRLSDSTIAMAPKAETDRAHGPNAAEEQPVVSSSAANTAAPSNIAVAQPTVSVVSNSAIGGSPVAKSPGASVPGTDSGSSAVGGNREEDKSAADTDALAKQMSTSPAPPPAPVLREQPKDLRDDKEKAKDSAPEVAAAKTDEFADNNARRDSPKLAAKRSGPSRMAGQVQQTESNISNMNVFENTATRKAGGKDFNLRNGVWYDVAYHGQSTRNVKRASEDFKKLDSGLRSISNSIDGVVVVVWKGKAYRFQ